MTFPQYPQQPTPQPPQYPGPPQPPCVPGHGVAPRLAGPPAIMAPPAYGAQPVAPAGTPLGRYTLVSGPPVSNGRRAAPWIIGAVVVVLLIGGGAASRVLTQAAHRSSAPSVVSAPLAQAPLDTSLNYFPVKIAGDASSPTVTVPQVDGWKSETPTSGLQGMFSNSDLGSIGFVPTAGVAITDLTGQVSTDDDVFRFDDDLKGLPGLSVTDKKQDELDGHPAEMTHFNWRPANLANSAQAVVYGTAELVSVPVGDKWYGVYFNVQGTDPEITSAAAGLMMNVRIR